MLLTRSPLSPGPKPRFSLDLHVLSAPPAFVLSQDQTLREETRCPDDRPRSGSREANLSLPSSLSSKGVSTPRAPPVRRRDVTRCEEVDGIRTDTHAAGPPPASRRSGAVARATTCLVVKTHAVEFSRTGAAWPGQQKASDSRQRPPGGSVRLGRIRFARRRLLGRVYRLLASLASGRWIVAEALRLSSRTCRSRARAGRQAPSSRTKRRLPGLQHGPCERRPREVEPVDDRRRPSLTAPWATSRRASLVESPERRREHGREVHGVAGRERDARRPPPARRPRGRPG